MPLFYTPADVEDILPQVREIVQRVLAVKKQADNVTDDSELTNVMKELESEIKKLEEIGCVLRDMSMGLVDFPAVRLGERVWLCWKLGEGHVKFWHSRREGYSGRKVVDEKEFYDDDLAIRSLNRELVSKPHP